MHYREKNLRLMAWILLCIVVPGLLASACSNAPSGTSSQATTSPTSKPTERPAPLPSHSLASIPPALTKLIGGTPVAGNQVIPLVFRLAFNDAALGQAVTQMYTPGSPTYQQFLSPAQIAQSYALPDAQVQLVVNWLTQHGFLNVSVDASHSSISVQAPVSTIERVLNTSLNSYTVFGHQFFIQQQPPTLPASVSAFVQSIVGLNDFATPQVKPPMNATAAQTKKDCSGYGIFGSLTRNKLAAAYQIDQLYRQNVQGQGMSVGIAEFDEPFSMADVQNYTACVGIPTPHIQNISVDGQVPPGFGESEAAMDVELIAGLAPKANILVYQGNYNTSTYESFALSLYDVFNKVATDDKVQVLSVSYGIGEEQFSTVDMYSINNVLQQLAAEGISVFVSSGDCAAFGLGVQGLASVNFPASAPYTFAVGGTHLEVNDQNRRTLEDVWSDNSGNNCQNQWGSGGGVSQTAAFKRPPWQVGPGTTTRYNGVRNNVTIIEGGPVVAPNGLRQVPDVSAAAYPNISIFYKGAWIFNGGTSAAAPIWAAGMVLVDEGLKLHHKASFGAVPNIYTIANHPGRYHPFTDIVSGTNLFYAATRGWDYATGWGSPNFNDILQLKLTQ